MFSRQEIQDALFEMSPLKALGIDGLHAQFYQSQWSTVGDSLEVMVRKGFDERFVVYCSHSKGSWA